MALIDKDATKVDMEKFNRPLCDGYHMKDYVLNQILNDIEDMPTVEAIPIKWIEKWAEKFYKVINGTKYYMGDGYDSVWDMLEDWEKRKWLRKD